MNDKEDAVEVMGPSDATKVRELLDQVVADTDLIVYGAETGLSRYSVERIRTLAQSTDTERQNHEHHL